MKAGVMVIGDLNGKAARVSQTQTAFENTTTDTEFTENSSKSHFGEEPFALALPERGQNGTWTWKVLACPYCHGQHNHGGGSGDAPALLGHRVVHCAVGTPGYIVVEVAQ